MGGGGPSGAPRGGRRLRGASAARARARRARPRRHAATRARAGAPQAVREGGRSSAPWRQRATGLTLTLHFLGTSEGSLGAGASIMRRGEWTRLTWRAGRHRRLRRGQLLPARASLGLCRARLALQPQTPLAIPFRVPRQLRCQRRRLLKYPRVCGPRACARRSARAQPRHHHAGSARLCGVGLRGRVDECPREGREHLHDTQRRRGADRQRGARAVRRSRAAPHRPRRERRAALGAIPPRGRGRERGGRVGVRGRRRGRRRCRRRLQLQLEDRRGGVRGLRRARGRVRRRGRSSGRTTAAGGGRREAGGELLSTEGVYSRDMGRGNSREGGGESTRLVAALHLFDQAVRCSQAPPQRVGLVPRATQLRERLRTLCLHRAGALGECDKAPWREGSDHGGVECQLPV